MKIKQLQNLRSLVFIASMFIGSAQAQSYNSKPELLAFENVIKEPSYGALTIKNHSGSSILNELDPECTMHIYVLSMYGGGTFYWRDAEYSTLEPGQQITFEVSGDETKKIRVAASANANEYFKQYTLNVGMNVSYSILCPMR